MDSIRLKTKELQSKMYLTQTQTHTLRLIDSLESIHDLSLRGRHRLFLACKYRDNPIFSLNVTSEICSETYLKTEQIQDC